MVIPFADRADAERFLKLRQCFIAGQMCGITTFIAKKLLKYCNLCHSLRHATDRCQNGRRCAKCTDAGHTTEDHNTDNALKCMNCSKEHESRDKNCPTRTQLLAAKGNGSKGETTPKPKPQTKKTGTKAKAPTNGPKALYSQAGGRNNVPTWRNTERERLSNNLTTSTAEGSEFPTLKSFLETNETWGNDDDEDNMQEYEREHPNKTVDQYLRHAIETTETKAGAPAIWHGYVGLALNSYSPEGAARARRLFREAPENTHAKANFDPPNGGWGEESHSDSMDEDLHQDSRSGTQTNGAGPSNNQNPPKKRRLNLTGPEEPRSESNNQ